MAGISGAVCPDCGVSPSAVSPVRPDGVVKSRRIKINVRGETFETYEHTLARFPGTLLGSRLQRKRYFNNASREYYFDRDRAAFDAILFYYQSAGILSRPETVPYDQFFNELQFFGIENEVISDPLKLASRKRQLRRNSRNHGAKLYKAQQKIWEFFDGLPVAPWQRVYCALSCLIIVISLLALCLETLPSVVEYQVYKPRNSSEEVVDFGNFWFTAEFVFTAWFSLEFVIRLACAPTLFTFLFSVGTLIDLLAIAPLYLAVGLPPRLALPPLLLGIVRLCRVQRLSRYSISVRLLFETILDSATQLKLFAMGFMFNTVLLSSAVFYLEGEGESEFKSIPDTFWYIIITLSSVGYGDFVPRTTGGKLVGTICCISGAVSMFCFTPVLFAEFRKCWQRYYRELLVIKLQVGKEPTEDRYFSSVSARLRLEDEKRTRRHPHPEDI